MAGLIFCILCNYSLIYCLRDSLVLPTLGAEAYSFLEFWIVLPAALVITLTYIRLSSLLRNHELIFYLFLGMFLTFFAIFALYLYPARAELMPSHAQVTSWTINYPHFRWFIVVLSAWPYALFNIFCELWASVMLALLFWQLANHIMRTDEAKHYYPLFGLVGNLALIVAGSLVHHYASHYTESTLINSITVAVFLLSGISALLYRYIHHAHKIKPISAKVNGRPKLSFKESIRLIMRSRYLGYMALMVVCYGLSINITQTIWKAQAVQFYQTAQDYAVFMGNFQRYIGIASILCTIIGWWILRRFQWVVAALTPAIVTGVSGTLFFSWLLLASQLKPYIQANTIMLFTIWLGMIEVILSKAMKFSLFDSSKELAYIPLSHDLKTKGKSAVDIMGERLGKAGGAFMQTMVLSIFPMVTYSMLSPYFMTVFLFVIATWIYAAISLNREYKKLI